MSKEDGGPAFARGMPGSDVAWDQKGMSLRQWFAGLAMMGMASMLADPGVDFSFRDCARMSYKQADAMLEEGAKQHE